MLFILKNIYSRFDSEAREPLCDDINNYCKLILMCWFSQSLRGETWGFPSSQMTLQQTMGDFKYQQHASYSIWTQNAMAYT